MTRRLKRRVRCVVTRSAVTTGGAWATGDEGFHVEKGDDGHVGDVGDGKEGN